MGQYNDNYWNKRFETYPIEKGVPERVKKAIKRIYSCYPKNCMPQGVCDPMYIMNVMALELGIGDGCGNFNLPEEEI